MLLWLRSSCVQVGQIFYLGTKHKSVFLCEFSDCEGSIYEDYCLLEHDAVKYYISRRFGGTSNPHFHGKQNKLSMENEVLM
jgi:hypothetical protein